MRSPPDITRQKTDRRTYSILLIEDSPSDVGLVREALTAHGVEGELVVIRDGDLACRYVESLNEPSRDCPDLFIIDLNLPKRSGREVLQAVNRNTRCDVSLVVVLSSSDAPQDKADAIALGADHYFKKPLLLDDFLSLGAAFKQLLGADE